MAIADYVTVSAEVMGAHAPVALETTAIAHGLPYPQNLDVAARLEAAVRAGGGVPAWCGLLDGRIRVGLTPAEIERFASSPEMPKASRRDFAPILSAGGSGATTVAGTMLCAAAANIRVFSTGGLGGVHRQVTDSLDISADLAELSRTPVAVVCSGAKAILDLPKTVEALETLGVPLVGYGTGSFPAFQVRESGLPVDARADTPSVAAALVETQLRLGLGGMVIGVPVPIGEALEASDVEVWVAQALSDAEQAKIRGKAITPFLLARLADLSGGRTLDANIALLENNARVAAEIAAALADRQGR